MTGELGVLLLGSAPEHGLSAKAVEIGHVVGFPVTNSMVVSWVAAFCLIVFVRVATRRMDQVPSGAQNFLEWLVESLYSFLEGLLGKHLVERTFWFFATVFIFILSSSRDIRRRIRSIATVATREFNHPLVEVRPVRKRAVILVAADKGLWRLRESLIPTTWRWWDYDRSRDRLEFFLITLA